MKTDLSHSILLRALCAGATLGLGAIGCDLDMKNLGDESESAGDDGNTDGVTPGDPCMPGEEAPADDGCNTCACGEDGTWACTLLACDPTGGPQCSPGETMPAGDGCNSCSCDDDGNWACTEIGCEPPECTPGDTMPTPDLCSTCTCEENGYWACPAIACVPDSEITVCDGTEPADPVTITDAIVAGDELVVTLQYGGGCEPHDFQYCWDGAFQESLPVQISTSISHDGHMDPCEAEPSEGKRFDLAPLRAAYEAGYGPGSASIIIHLAGWPGSLEYAW